LARHRSPDDQQPAPNRLIPAGRHRRRPARGLPVTPALCGAAVGVVAAGTFAVSQPVSLASANFDLAADGVASPAAGAYEATEPAPPQTMVLEQDRSHELEALAKGVALAEDRIRAAEEAERAARAAGTSDPSSESDDEAETDDDACPSSGFGGVAPHVARAGHHLQELFDVEEVGGVAKRPGNPTSDHPRGYALDFMVDRSTGDALAAYAEEHAEALGISYILWEVANHYEHVHISFDDESGSGLPC